MNKSLTAALMCAVLVAVAPPASAGIVPGVAVDGPSAEVQDVQPRIDVAPDGSAALVYLKQVGGVNHVFVSSFVGGAWTPGADVDPALAQAASQPRIAVANGGKVAVTYKQGAGAVVAQVRPATGAAFGPAATLAPAGSYAEIDLAGSGNGYAVGTDTNNIFAQRLDGTTWAPVAPAPLDKNPAAEAGASNNEARVATAPDGGSAVVTWGEVIDGGMQTDVFARRLTGATAGPVGAGGHIVTPLPGADPYDAMFVPVADQPEVDIDATGTAWVVFRQNMRYGGVNIRHRAFTRPFTADAFGGAQHVDSMPEVPTEGRDFQRIDVNDAGQGLLTHYGNLTNPVEFATLAGGTWTKAGLVEPAANATTPLSAPAIGDNGSGLIAYKFQPAPAQPIVTRARTTFGGLGAELTLSNPALGEVVSGSDAAAGPGAFAAVTFAQRTGLQNSIVAAVVDLPQPPPPPPNGADTTAPDVTGLRLSRKRFRLGSALPSAAAVGTGTVIRFRLSEAASVRLTFSRALPGRRVRGACRKQTRRNRSRRPCTRFVTVRGAVITRSLAAGARRINFAGRVSRRRSLKPGVYRLSLVGRDQAGNASRPDRAKFTLLKKKKRRRGPR